MRRGGGYHEGGGFGGGGGYDYGGGASALGGTYSGAYGHPGAPPQEAFPAYSPSSKYRKGKLNTVTAVIGALLVLVSVTSVYLFVRTNTLTEKAEKLSVELSASRVELSTSQAQHSKGDREHLMLKRDLDVAREKLDDKSRRVDEANKSLQEVTEQLKGLKDEVRRCNADLETAHTHEAEIQLKLETAEQGRNKETVDTAALQKDLMTAQVAAKAADSRLRQNEKEWEQEKKILKLDLELAKATIERYEMAKETQDSEPVEDAAKETAEANLSGPYSPPVDSVPEAASSEEAAAKPEAEQGEQEEPKAAVEVPVIAEPIHDANVPPLIAEPVHDDENAVPKEGEEAAAAGHPDPEAEPVAAVAEEQGAEVEAKDEEVAEEATRSNRELRRRARIERSSAAERGGDEGEGEGAAKE